MPVRSWKFYACVFVAAALFAAPAAAQKESPLAKFGGTWAGNGLIYLSNGSKERIRCRGGFTATDVALSLDLRCAGDSYVFELSSQLNYDGSSVKGFWSERSRNVNGNVTGTLDGDQIKAIAESPTFTAILELINLGDKQQIRLSSPGSEITDVLIGLVRSGRSVGSNN